MDYKEKYEQALERCMKLYNEAKANEYASDIEDYETIFPELKESEDERIKKAIKYCIKQGFIGYGEIENVTPDECLAWLEKQGKKPKKVSIWKHWKNGIAGGTDEQVFLIKIGREYYISSCLGCECDYIELSELDKLQRMEE